MTFKVCEAQVCYVVMPTLALGLISQETLNKSVFSIPPYAMLKKTLNVLPESFLLNISGRARSPSKTLDGCFLMMKTSSSHEGNPTT